MATIRLVPSSYELSSTQYLSISNASNMYDNTDSTNYATITNTRNNSTSSYYIYLRGFNFNDIPSNAVVSSFTIKLKASESGVAQSSSYQPYLANGTSIINGSCSYPTTTVQTFTFSGISADWDTIAGYGDNFGIRINCRRASRNTTSYMYIYGAEIEVEYTIPTPINITSVLTSGSGTLNPLGTTVMYENDEYTLTITPTNTSDDVTLERDGIDVSADLEAHWSGGQQTINTDLGTYALVSGGFNGSGASYFQSIVGKGYNGSTTTSNYYSSGSGTIAVFTYDMGITGLPSNATIDRVYAMVNGHAESTSNSNEYMCAQLISGSTELTEEYNFKEAGTTNTTQTLECTTIPTISQLANMKLQCRLGYYGGAINGATVFVKYSTPQTTDPDYYTYTFTVGANDVLLEVTIGNAPYIPPEEDPTETYYSLTISSINADTNPLNGTTRVVEGSNQTITITPTDPQLTLALDNGVDVTSQLQGGFGNNTYTVTGKTSGASYGFELNGNNYYESTNQGIATSASVCRVNFEFDNNCLVTISYINYAEATYDYGVFGNIDTTLSTTYNNNNGAYHACSSSSESTANVQTLTYEINAGSHYIDIKYFKDNYTDNHNDSLQWKIESIEPISGGEYTYTLTNITQKHSLIFVFGDVTFYYINSSTTSGGRIFPDGQQVKLPGDNYKLNIVPDNVGSAVNLTDNGVNVTAQLEQKTGVDKNNNPIVSYSYELSNIQATHTLFVTIGEVTTQIYIKESGIWTPYSKVYKKINGSWVEQSDISGVFSTSANYVKGN